MICPNCENRTLNKTDRTILSQPLFVCSICGIRFTHVGWEKKRND